MKMLAKCVALMIVAASSLPPGLVQADIIALQSFSGGVNAIAGSDQLYGWRFDVLSSINVTALGVYDESNDGLAISHDVGIYRLSDQALVASATVPSGTSGVLDAGFRYIGLSSNQLLIPDTYIIVATMPAFNNDHQSILNTSVGTASEIKYVTSEFGGSSVLAFPSLSYEGNYAEGMFGPNFQFAAAVPEPASLTLVGVGTFGLVAGAIRRRRQQKAAV